MELTEERIRELICEELEEIRGNKGLAKDWLALKKEIEVFSSVNRKERQTRSSIQDGVQMAIKNKLGLKNKQVKIAR
ncbi:hypothetical protein BH747_12030 [Enterococcus villorum]|uniref:Uncharacterized protein n=1 Tax=Enterococcus villorum TaxID=112904 RepID=A0A1V8Y719_9ENTE|nr:hypothetical protein [Enterococcus villorum]OQO68404.1 hypothetical protein BH747_12030 [Enterococcus villorum]OQO74351.1 hypothetical protein BH744_07380 [Enterococcus villorum]